MAESGVAFSVTSVACGEVDALGDDLVLTFEAQEGPVRLTLPASELAALLSVCIGLSGQGLPEGGESEHPTVPVADWRVGVTGSNALVLGLAPDAGGALAFHLAPAQAREMAAALRRGVEMLDVGGTPARPAPRGH